MCLCIDNYAQKIISTVSVSSLTQCLTEWFRFYLAGSQKVGDTTRVSVRAWKSAYRDTPLFHYQPITAEESPYDVSCWYDFNRSNNTNYDNLWNKPCEYICWSAHILDVCNYFVLAVRAYTGSLRSRNISTQSSHISDITFDLVTRLWHTLEYC